jgi:hypothetical protein
MYWGRPWDLHFCNIFFINYQFLTLLKGAQRVRWHKIVPELHTNCRQKGINNIVVESLAVEQAGHVHFCDQAGPDKMLTMVENSICIILPTYQNFHPVPFALHNPIPAKEIVRAQRTRQTVPYRCLAGKTS